MQAASSQEIKPQWAQAISSTQFKENQTQLQIWWSKVVPVEDWAIKITKILAQLQVVKLMKSLLLRVRVLMLRKKMWPNLLFNNNRSKKKQS